MTGVNWEMEREKDNVIFQFTPVTLGQSLLGKKLRKVCTFAHDDYKSASHLDFKTSKGPKITPSDHKQGEKEGKMRTYIIEWRHKKASIP